MIGTVPVRRREHIDDDDDPNDPLESDQDSPSMLDVIDCPYCGQPVSDMADRCPKCGSYFSREDMPPSQQARRTTIGVIVIVVVLILVTLLMR